MQFFRRSKKDQSKRSSHNDGVGDHDVAAYEKGSKKTVKNSVFGFPHAKHRKANRDAPAMRSVESHNYRPSSTLDKRASALPSISSSKRQHSNEGVSWRRESRSGDERADASQTTQDSRSVDVDGYDTSMLETASLNDVASYPLDGPLQQQHQQPSMSQPPSAAQNQQSPWPRQRALPVVKPLRSFEAEGDIPLADPTTVSDDARFQDCLNGNRGPTLSGHQRSRRAFSSGAAAAPSPPPRQRLAPLDSSSAMDERDGSRGEKEGTNRTAVGSDEMPNRSVRPLEAVAPAPPVPQLHARERWNASSADTPSPDLPYADASYPGGSGVAGGITTVLYSTDQSEEVASVDPHRQLGRAAIEQYGRAEGRARFLQQQQQLRNMNSTALSATQTPVLHVATRSSEARGSLLTPTTVQPSPGSMSRQRMTSHLPPPTHTTPHRTESNSSILTYQRDVDPTKMPTSTALLEPISRLPSYGDFIDLYCRTDDDAEDYDDDDDDDDDDVAVDGDNDTSCEMYELNAKNEDDGKSLERVHSLDADLLNTFMFLGFPDALQSTEDVDASNQARASAISIFQSTVANASDQFEVYSYGMPESLSSSRPTDGSSLLDHFLEYSGSGRFPPAGAAATAASGNDSGSGDKLQGILFHGSCNSEKGICGSSTSHRKQARASTALQQQNQMMSALRYSPQSPTLANCQRLQVPAPSHGGSSCSNGGRGGGTRRFSAERVLSLIAVQAPYNEFCAIPRDVSFPVIQLRPVGRDSHLLSEMVMDEVVEYDPKLAEMRMAGGGSVIRSSLIDELSDQVLQGHTAVMVLAAGGGSDATVKALVERALGQIYEKLRNREQMATAAGGSQPGSGAFFFRVEVSVCAFDRACQVRNLIPLTPTAAGLPRSVTNDKRNDNYVGLEPQPMRLVYNPTVGCWVKGIPLTEIASADASDLAKVTVPIDAWLRSSASAPTGAEEMLAMYVLIRQTRDLYTSDPESRNLVLSSLTLLMTRDPNYAQSICIYPGRHPSQIRGLVDRVGDGGFTVAAACLSKDTVEPREYVSFCRELSSVRNGPLLSGNVRRYLDFTAASNARLQEAAAATEDPKKMALARATIAMHVGFINSMLRLVADPENVPVPFDCHNVPYQDERSTAIITKDSKMKDVKQAESSGDPALVNGRPQVESAFPPMPRSSHDVNADIKEVAETSIRPAKSASATAAPVVRKNNINNSGSGNLHFLRGLTGVPLQRHSSPHLLKLLPSSSERSASLPFSYGGYSSGTIGTSGTSLTREVHAGLDESGGVSTVLFCDRRVHRVAYVEEGICGFNISRKGTSVEEISTHTQLPVDEAISLERVTSTRQSQNTRSTGQVRGTKTSSQFKALADVFASGRSCAIMAVEDSSCLLTHSLAWPAVRQAIAAALSHTGDRSRNVQVSMSLLRAGDTAVELLERPAEPRHLLLSCSPVFGPIVHDAVRVQLRSTSEWDDLRIGAMRQAALFWAPETCIYVSVLNLFSTRTDVFTCSLSVSLFGSHTAWCTRVIKGKESPRINLLNRSALSGAAASVVLGSFASAAESPDVAALFRLTIPVVKEILHSGSIGRFVQRTEQALTDRVEERASRSSQSIDASTKSAMMTDKWITKMLADYKRVVRDPNGSYPLAYVMFEPEDDTTRAGNANGTSGKINMPPVTASGASLPTTNCPTSSRPSPGTLLENNTTFTTYNTHSSQTVTTTGMPNAHPRLLLGMDSKGSLCSCVSCDHGRVVWLPTGETFECDEDALFYTATDPESRMPFAKSHLVSSLMDCVRKARSCAIAGVMDDCDYSSSTTPVASVASCTRPLWSVFRGVLASVAFLPDWEESSEVQLRIVALRDRQIVRDFLADEQQQPQSPPSYIMVEASPLFGPVVHNASMVSAKTLTECISTMKIGVNRVERVMDSLEPGTVIVASAVVKRVTKTERDEEDVALSSFTAFCFRVSRDLPVLREVLAMDPNGSLPPSLYRYMFGGPCKFLALGTLNGCTRELGLEALQLLQRIRFLTTYPVPRGGVRAFLDYQRRRLAYTQKQVEGSSSAAGSGSVDPSQELVTRMMADMEQLLKSPASSMRLPAYLVEDCNGMDRSEEDEGERAAEFDDAVAAAFTARRSQAPLQSIRSVAVVTTDESSTNARAARGSREPPLNVNASVQTIVSAQGTYRFSEVLQRADALAVVRPSTLEDIASKVLGGFNAVLMLADATGSTAARAVLERVISGVGDRLLADSRVSLFISMVSLRHEPGRGDVSKDVLRRVEYDDCRVAASPLFGFCIENANYRRAESVAELVATMRDTLTLCKEDKSAMVMSLVIKKIVKEEDDVYMNSILAVLTTPHTENTTQYSPHMFAQASADPDQLMHLITRALESPCHAYGFTGVATSTPREEREALLRLGSELMKLRTMVPRVGSARRVLTIADKALSASPLRTSGRDINPTAVAAAAAAICDVDEVPAAGWWSWQKVQRDLRRLLEAPEETKPKSYQIDLCLSDNVIQL